MPEGQPNPPSVVVVSQREPFPRTHEEMQAMSDRPGGQPFRPDPMTAAVQDAKQVAGQAKQVAGEAVDQLKDKAVGLAGEARTQGEDLLGTARERAESLAEEGKAAGAEKASVLADAIRNAARDLEGASPEIAHHVRGAADSVQGIAAALRDRSAGQLFEDVSDFARRQPTAFFGVAAVAGFALARFMKSSTAMQPGGMAGSGQHAPGWVQASPGRSARPATMAAASLGGAAAHHAGEARPGSMPTSTPMPSMPSAPPSSGSSSGPHMAGAMPNERSGSAL
jgi:uncharacterized protein YjbJ (UPF0337 family)